MQLIRGHADLRLSRRLPRCVVTMGNFDGFHRGHQQLLAGLREQAQRLRSPSVVITFEPHPREFLNPESTPPRLMRFHEKWRFLLGQKIDYLVCLRFNALLAKCPPVDFVRDMLIAQLGMQAIVVGEDFRFGARRAGDVQLLEQLGRQYDFSTLIVPAIMKDGERISSTRVRQALQANHLPQARDMLGGNYFLCGKVVHGDARGRTWGFPTANIHLTDKPVAVAGIYVVRVLGIAEQPLPGVASVGVRPMFSNHRVLLEVHLLDFNRDIYSRPLVVEFLHKLRDEQVFADTAQLIRQIQIDVQQTREYFERETHDGPIH
jgi:riboflavin kinase / FMN adenylyltransferase